MHTRVPVAALMFLTSCYLPLPSAETSSTQEHVRVVTVEPASANTSPLGISIALPKPAIECEDVLLVVVGARRAVLGERVVLEASASVSADDVAEPTLHWESDDAEVTVVGPASAEMSCDTIGMHTVDVKLAPPAPCPAAVQVEIDCVTADR